MISLCIYTSSWKVDDDFLCLDRDPKTRKSAFELVRIIDNEGKELVMCLYYF